MHAPPDLSALNSYNPLNNFNLPALINPALYLAQFLPQLLNQLPLLNQTLNSGQHAHNPNASSYFNQPPQMQMMPSAMDLFAAILLASQMAQTTTPAPSTHVNTQNIKQEEQVAAGSSHQDSGTETGSSSLDNSLSPTVPPPNNTPIFGFQNGIPKVSPQPKNVSEGAQFWMIYHFDPNAPAPPPKKRKRNSNPKLQTPVSKLPPPSLNQPQAEFSPLPASMPLPAPIPLMQNSTMFSNGFKQEFSSKCTSHNPNPRVVKPVQAAVAQQQQHQQNYTAACAAAAAQAAASKELCAVCGDKASGYHYSALSCEGCKYQCNKTGQCQVDRTNRNRCQSCRFEKCVQAGMLKENIKNEKNRKRRSKELEREQELDETIETLNMLKNIHQAFESSRISSNTPIPSVEEANTIAREFLDKITAFEEFCPDEKDTLVIHGLEAFLILRASFCDDHNCVDQLCAAEKPQLEESNCDKDSVLLVSPKNEYSEFEGCEPTATIVNQSEDQTIHSDIGMDGDKKENYDNSSSPNLPKTTAEKLERFRHGLPKDIVLNEELAVLMTMVLCQTSSPGLPEKRDLVEELSSKLTNCLHSQMCIRNYDKFNAKAYTNLIRKIAELCH
uniref:Nuclear receptor domain-containing protein n=1 Tax=Ditylenchus dipsaci TaxID=166011 RepID=A0A915DJ39_9BILA